MITIENVEKIIGRQIKHYQITSVQLFGDEYIFHLYDDDTISRTIFVSLTRNRNKNGDYELKSIGKDTLYLDTQWLKSPAVLALAIKSLF